MFKLSEQDPKFIADILRSLESRKVSNGNILNLFTDKSNLIGSIIGARVCYSKDDFESMIAKDERILNKNEAIKYMSRIYGMKHYSVFAHTLTEPIIIKLYDELDDKIFFKLSSVYKTYSYIDYENHVGYIMFNLRHILEAIDIIKNSNAYNLYYNQYFSDSLCEKLFSKYDPANALKHINKLNDNVYMIYNDLDNKSIPINIRYVTLFIQNVSRAATRQLLRHNFTFTERSQRYVELNESFRFITPHSIKNNKDALDHYNSFIETMKNTYHNLRKHGIPKEDSRYVLGNMTSTSLVVTMSYSELTEFVKKRNIPQAQWEIRELAEILGKQLLN